MLRAPPWACELTGVVLVALDIGCGGAARETSPPEPSPQATATAAPVGGPEAPVAAPEPPARSEMAFSPAPMIASERIAVEVIIDGRRPDERMIDNETIVVAEGGASGSAVVTVDEVGPDPAHLTGQSWTVRWSEGAVTPGCGDRLCNLADARVAAVLALRSAAQGTLRVGDRADRIAELPALLFRAVTRSSATLVRFEGDSAVFAIEADGSQQGPPQGEVTANQGTSVQLTGEIWVSSDLRYAEGHVSGHYVTTHSGLFDAHGTHGEMRMTFDLVPAGQ